MLDRFGKVKSSWLTLGALLSFAIFLFLEPTLLNFSSPIGGAGDPSQNGGIDLVFLVVLLKLTSLELGVNNTTGFVL